MTSTRDTQKIQFLCYSDITIKLVDGDKLENLQADILITMKRRRSEHDPKKNRTVRLHCLTDPQDGILCPIKMIIASAMRLGAVNGRTIEEVLEATRQRQDKTSNAVVVDKAAEIRQEITTIRERSLKAGFCAVVTPHDMRR
ncbi:hypothetical protein GMDG_03609 [Pseudogymnoascus destructans 20631-21]|uniref:Uncharacterized protein n=1 Tax=Pseudogymnoascus destructans (strain ATCC MYA-4855 / 20631-21) TaxID=658429 RepID=L8G744_PSED2|nr:hypothetical protein GMDG_03609 [Pseudogymnoascus destructans 20631-21]